MTLKNHADPKWKGKGIEFSAEMDRSSSGKNGGSKNGSKTVPSRLVLLELLSTQNSKITTGVGAIKDKIQWQYSNYRFDCWQLATVS